MNFNFNQRRFHIGPPIMRHYSTIGLVGAKPELIDFTLKPDCVFKNVQNNFFGASVFQNKSFSNPNYVNKQNPNILTPSSVARHFDKSYIAHPILENVKNSCVIQPPQHGRTTQDNHLVYQSIPDQQSSQHNSPKLETESNNSHSVSPKSSKKNLRSSRKNRKSKRSKQEFIAIEPSADQKSKMTQKKADKSWCSLPKRLKKDHESSRRCKKGKKDKQWHKISLDMEIMELDDTAYGVPESPGCPVLETPAKSTFCVQLKSSPIEISPKCSLNLCESALSVSVSPCTEFLRNLSTSNTSTSDYSCSPASPAVRRLRMPSECDSEDSFIVFCDDGSVCMSEDEPLSSAEEVDSDEADSDTGFDVTDFCAKTDLNRESAKKKVSFKTDSELCDVHPMVQWSFAYQKARIGPWEQYARDRARFETRIQNTESILSGVLQRDHRDKIFSERFNNPD